MMWVLISGGPCTAEDASVKKLSLADAINTAINSNAEVKQAEVGEQDSLSRLRIAGFSTKLDIGSQAAMERDPDDSAFSSNIFGSLTYENMLGTKASVEVTPFGFGNDRGALGLRITKPLIRGKGVLSDKSDMVLGARSDAEVSNMQYYLVRQAKVLEIINTYYRAVLAREQVKVQEEALALVEEAADGARKREAAGLVRGIDVSRAENRVAETRNQLNLQRQAARAALDRLMVAIGSELMLKESQAFELTDNVPDAAPEPPGLADAVKTALSRRSELAISDQQLSEQERKLAVRQDRLRTEFNAVARFNSTNADPGIITSSLYDLGSLNMGFELRLPLDKRIDVEERDIASRDLDVLKKMRLLRMEEIAEEVRSAHRAVESERTTLEIFNENLDIAKDRLKIAQRMVEEGLESNREVLDAQESLTHLTSGILSAKTDVYLASVRLRYAMGEDLMTIGLQ